MVADGQRGVRWSFRRRRTARNAPTAPLPEVVGIVDPGVAERLAIDGCVRLGQILTPDEVATARSVFDEVVRRLDRPIGEEWFPTILLPDDEVRALITEELGTVITPHLEGVIDPARIELMRLDFSVKPPSRRSELGPHQDFSLVDERRATSLYLWIPLEDMDEHNGTLHVVPGSHRFSNRIRSQHVPSTFDEVLPEVREAAERLDCRAGELILMVSGVIHFSPANQGDRVRLAAHGILVPRGEPLVFYFADEQTPQGLVECYRFDLEGYVRHIHQGRPSGRSPDELVDRPPPMTLERFLAGLESSRGSARRRV